MTQKLASTNGSSPQPDSDNKNIVANSCDTPGCNESIGGSSPAFIDEAIKADVEAAVACMRAGGIILYPSDTVWGVGCDATCPEAVKKIFKLKKRDDSKAMLSLTYSMEQLTRYVGAASAEQAVKLTVEQSPRPVTIIMDNAQGIAPQLIALDGSAAFRLTREAFSSALCRELGSPVVSTSANVSGQNSPAIFCEIDKAIIEGVDFVVNYRQDDNRRATPSKIVKLNDNGSITTLRE